MITILLNYICFLVIKKQFSSEKLKNTLSLYLQMVEEIIFRTVIEILGKPKEHVEKALKDYVKQIKEDENFKVIKEDFAEIKKQEDQDLWAIFVELEIKTAKIDHIIDFCFEYMPSILEIVNPKKLTLEDSQISGFLNDLQAKLHQVDMVAKQVKLENDHLKTNMAGLLKNYIVVLLSKANLTSQQLSKLTGVRQEKLEDFLDQLIDEGKIDLKEGVYFNTEKALKN